MNFRREGLAAIYYKSKNNDCLFLKCVALVNYNPLNKNFIITSGEFAGKTNSDFNKIVGNEKYIYKDNTFVNFVDNNKDLSAFIISERFINTAFDADMKTSLYDIYLEIAQRLSGVLLLKKDNKLVSMFSYISYIQKAFSEEQVNNMLGYEEIKDETLDDEESNVSSMVLPIGMQMIMALGGDVREMSQNEGELQLVDISRKEKDSDANKEQLNINEIITDINSKIVGQESAVKTLVTNIYYNQVLIDSLSNEKDIDLSELDSRKVSILLDGSTGTGKTAILKDIASKLNLPIDIVNANSFSETGYVGPTITDILSRLLKQANGNLELAERGIIVLDEIDKIATPDTYEGKDMKKGVQEELLAFIGGGKYDVSTSNSFIKTSTTFDTSKITFILSGAFTKLRESKIKEQEKKFNGIGFNTAYSNAKNEYEITAQDYIDYGLMREFFGRIKVLTSTRSYTKEDLRKILLESRISPLKNLEKTAQMFGYNGLTYNEDFINEICEEAMKLDTGARGLQSIMSGIQNMILMNLINREYNEDEPIDINNNILSEYKKGNIRTYTRKK